MISLGITLAIFLSFAFTLIKPLHFWIGIIIMALVTYKLIPYIRKREENK
ncbi:MAG: hypothetical protein ACQEP1_06640 [Nanobdellota archaeon]